jgi:hypothetical protein
VPCGSRIIRARLAGLAVLDLIRVAQNVAFNEVPRRELLGATDFRYLVRNDGSLCYPARIHCSARENHAPTVS